MMEFLSKVSGARRGYPTAISEGLANLIALNFAKARGACFIVQSTTDPQADLTDAAETFLLMGHFDPESGQIYYETIVKHVPYIAWEHKIPGKKPRNVLSSHGADSLKAVVLRKIVCHASRLEPQSFESVPSHLVKEINSTIREWSVQQMDLLVQSLTCYS